MAEQHLYQGAPWEAPAGGDTKSLDFDESHYPGKALGIIGNENKKPWNELQIGDRVNFTSNDKSNVAVAFEIRNLRHKSILGGSYDSVQMTGTTDSGTRCLIAYIRHAGGERATLFFEPQAATVHSAAIEQIEKRYTDVMLSKTYKPDQLIALKRQRIQLNGNPVLKVLDVLVNHDHSFSETQGTHTLIVEGPDGNEGFLEIYDEQRQAHLFM